jgi:CRISPR-associated protein Cas2
MILESVPTSVRGELTRWLLELKAGVFVGTISAAVRETLWKSVCGKLRGGAALLVHNMANEQGYAIKYSGDTSRLVEDYEGLLLIKFPQTGKPSEDITAV